MVAAAILAACEGGFQPPGKAVIRVSTYANLEMAAAYVAACSAGVATPLDVRQTC